MFNQLRSNVRNLLCGATLAETELFITTAIERGDAEVACYAREFVAELVDELSAEPTSA
jgi:hypothetical protein